MGVTSTKVHTKTLVTTGESEVTNNNPSKLPDDVTREPDN